MTPQDITLTIQQTTSGFSISDYIALGSAAIYLLTFILLIYQLLVSRKQVSYLQSQINDAQIHAERSVKPAVMSNMSFPEKDKTGRVYLQNSGIGPAVLKSVSIYREGKRVDGTLTESCEEVLSEIGMMTFIKPTGRHSYQRDYVIAPGEQLTIAEFEYTTDPDSESSALISSAMDVREIQIETHYEDMYGNSFSRLDPQPGNEL